MSNLIARATSNVHQTDPAELRQEVSRVSPSQVAVQSIAAGEKSTLKDNVQSVTLNLADRAFYFDLKLLQCLVPHPERREESEFVDVPFSTPLQPDQTYRVSVSPSLNSIPPRLA